MMSRLAIMVVTLILTVFGGVHAETVVRFPTNGLPIMAEFGSTTCVPCKMMEPVLENIKEEYKDKVEVVFIDVKEDFRPKSVYKIRMIPTQVFFDKNGVEVTRHEGFLSEKPISRILNKIIGETN
jgi:thioredoxin 1